ncbi:MAG TPA: PP0621 family protein [Burkholderiales bacterium]|nr:PP0621 family protein [Burkholderiales bacterium]
MGQLTRIVIILLALWLVVHFVRRALARHRQSSGPTANDPARMVACAVCGTHVPESEAIRANDKVYCGEQHRKMDGD